MAVEVLLPLTGSSILGAINGITEGYRRTPRIKKVGGVVAIGAAAFGYLKYKRSDERDW